MSMVRSQIYHVCSRLFTRPKTIRSDKTSGKVVITVSFWTTIRRCWFHVAPLTTCSIILYLNINGTFIGADFVGPVKSQTINLIFLQVAAKVNELLITASLAFVILHIVRHELLFGDGLPMGLIGSGLSFNNFQYFFTREFYGSLKYLAKPGNVFRKLGFVALLVMSGLIALLAGPASAVLIVPQEQLWNSGGTTFFMNGTSDIFHPADVVVNMDEISQYCAASNSTSLGICPGGGFLSLLERWSRVNYTNFANHDVPSFARELSGSSFFWPVHSPFSQIPSLYTLGAPRTNNDLKSNTFLVQPHAATAAILQRISIDWWRSILSKTRFEESQIGDRAVQALTPSAITTVRCAQPRLLTASENELSFPVIDGRFDYADPRNFTLNLPTSLPSDHLRFQWVQLPDEFGVTSTGAIFESKWSADGQSRVVFGCTAQSGWVPVTIFTDKYSFWTGWYPWNIQFGERSPSWHAPTPGEASQPTNGRVAFSTSWLDLLNPPAPVSISGSQIGTPSTIETVLDGAGFSADFDFQTESVEQNWMFSDVDDPGRGPLLEAIIASFLVDGLSRSGSHRVFNTTGPVHTWQLALYDPLPDFSERILANRTAFHNASSAHGDLLTGFVSMQISGFALQRSLPAFLAMSLLLVFMALALFHTMWILAYRRTSRSWKSISELMVLAQNSTPAFGVPSDTRDEEAAAQVVRIRACRKQNHASYDHLELIFNHPYLDRPRHSYNSEASKNKQGMERHARKQPSTLHVNEVRMYAMDELQPRGFDMRTTSSSTERLIDRGSRAGPAMSVHMVRVNEVYR